MRRPIQLQLVMPMMVIAVVAIAVTSIVGAWLIGRENFRRHRRSQERLIATLTTGGFPLHESVLRRMAGLSGAEFVVLDQAGAIAAATLSVSAGQARLLPGTADLANQPEASRTVTIGQDTFSAERVPIRAAGASDVGRWLIVLHPQDLWWRVGREGVWAPLGVGAAMAAVVCWAAAHLARRWQRPIVALRDHTRHIAAGEFVPAELPTTDDEIRDLAEAVNQMTQRLADYELTVRGQERLKVLGQLGAGMAHQIRNAVAGARLAVDLHARACSDRGGRESLAVALRQLQLLEDQLGRLLTLGRPRALELCRLDLVEAVHQVVELTAFSLRHQQVAVDWQRPLEAVWVEGDMEALRQALVNLALNAAQAVEGRAAPRVKFQVERRDDAGEIQIQDNGPGPTTETACKMFDPLVTTRREGTGLGLSVAREWIEAHGGALTWRRQGEWTVFVVRIPLAAPLPERWTEARFELEAENGAVVDR